MNSKSQKIPISSSVTKFSEFIPLIHQLAKQFSDFSTEFSIKPDVLKYWANDLLPKWIEDSTMPLYVRKSGVKYLKGSEIIHDSGRTIIPVDNGPAHWAISMAFNENMPTPEEIRTDWINQDRINIAMIISKEHASKVKYKCDGHIVDNPNEKGWKVAHIEAIGLNSKTALEHKNLDELKSHFYKFMNPANMFLIPKAFSGLAEIEEFLKSYKELISKTSYYK